MASNQTMTGGSLREHQRVIDYERLANKTFSVAVFLASVVNLSRPHAPLWSSPAMKRVQNAADFFDHLRLRYIGIFQRPRLLLAAHEQAFDYEVRKLFSGDIQNRGDIWPCYADISCCQNRPHMAMGGLQHIADEFGELMQEVSVLCEVYAINLL